jgi:hypothetical protein
MPCNMLPSTARCACVLGSGAAKDHSESTANYTRARLALGRPDSGISIESESPDATVLLSEELVKSWGSEAELGIYESIDLAVSVHSNSLSNRTAPVLIEAMRNTTSPSQTQNAGVVCNFRCSMPRIIRPSRLFRTEVAGAD